MKFFWTFVTILKNRTVLYDILLFDHLLKQNKHLASVMFIYIMLLDPMWWIQEYSQLTPYFWVFQLYSFPQIRIKITKTGIAKSKGMNIMVILYFTGCFLQLRQASGYTVEQDKILVFTELTVFSGEYRLRGEQPETVKKISDSDSITTETELLF